MVMCREKKGIYLVDIPRGIDTRKMNELWSAFENLKNGVAFDDRYSFRLEYFDSPNICVFTNVDPPLSMLSADRWVIWEIVDNALVSLTDGVSSPDLEEEDYLIH